MLILCTACWVLAPGCAILLRARAPPGSLGGHPAASEGTRRPRRARPTCTARPLRPPSNFTRTAMALMLSVVLSFVPAFCYAAVVYWIDRYEKEPGALLLGVFVWGAVIAVIGAIFWGLLFQ